MDNKSFFAGVLVGGVVTGALLYAYNKYRNRYDSECIEHYDNVDNEDTDDHIITSDYKSDALTSTDDIMNYINNTKNKKQTKINEKNEIEGDLEITEETTNVSNKKEVNMNKNVLVSDKTMINAARYKSFTFITEDEFDNNIEYEKETIYADIPNEQEIDEFDLDDKYDVSPEFTYDDPENSKYDIIFNDIEFAAFCKNMIFNKYKSKAALDSTFFIRLDYKNEKKDYKVLL